METNIKVIPFDLEKFKAWQKALTRDGRVATFIALCQECNERARLIVKLADQSHVAHYSLDGACINERLHLMSIVSRHQELIDSYDPENVYQWQPFYDGDDWHTLVVKPNFLEFHDYRIHPHNDIIKAFKRGEKIEQLELNSDGSDWWLELEREPSWSDHEIYRIKLEFAYPIYKKSNLDNTVVMFSDIKTGEVVEEGDRRDRQKGYRSGCWIEHTDSHYWKDWTPQETKQKVTHCLCYRVEDVGCSVSTTLSVSTKDDAIKNGYYIIQEWEVNHG